MSNYSDTVVLTIKKEWAMPNSNTFLVTPIKQFILDNKINNGVVVDPFANTCPLKECFTNCVYISNDLDNDMPTDYHLDAIEFLKSLEDSSADMILFDPPYSPRQVSECYKKMGKTVNMGTTQASFWGNIKKEVGRVLKPNGICISFGWNSNGIGKSNGFQQEKNTYGRTWW